MSRTAILLGASGILGSGFTTCLRSRPSTHLVAPTMPWGDPEGVAETLRRTLQGLPQAPTDVFWAAGTGRISASGDEMRTETRTVEMVVDLLEGPARSWRRHLLLRIVGRCTVRRAWFYCHQLRNPTLTRDRLRGGEVAAGGSRRRALGFWRLQNRGR
jgi:hypothetical protein